MRRMIGVACLAALFGITLLTPSNVLKAQSGPTVTLTWTAPVGASAVGATYRVKRGTSAGAETLLASVTAPATTYVDSSGTVGQTYFYVVTTFNPSFSNPESMPSNEVSATFLFQGRPGAPGSLAAMNN